MSNLRGRTLERNALEKIGGKRDRFQYITSLTPSTIANVGPNLLPPYSPVKGPFGARDGIDSSFHFASLQ